MTNYAGFWKRFLALIIDGILIGILSSIIFSVLGIGMFSSMSDSEDPTAAFAAIMAMFSGVGLILQVGYILYYALMESSKYQATLGKLALGIKVTDANGAKIDFVKALIRNVAKIVSQIILFIGYIMAAFTAKKQALHDIIAGTIVVNK